MAYNPRPPSSARRAARPPRSASSASPRRPASARGSPGYMRPRSSHSRMRSSVPPGKQDAVRKAHLRNLERKRREEMHANKLTPDEEKYQRALVQSSSCKASPKEKKSNFLFSLLFATRLSVLLNALRSGCVTHPLPSTTRLRGIHLSCFYCPRVSFPPPWYFPQQQKKRRRFFFGC